ncbi:MAG: hypothetical protein KF862_18300 [Chitinophagaceae bacterium]|nr:hypothetical protein [Chitinophagaceae bacterium]
MDIAKAFWKYINPFSKPEAYIGVQAKTTVQKKGDVGKMVIPFGIQGSYQEGSGFQTTGIGPLDSYYNLGVKNFVDIRSMPGRADFINGDLVSARTLITMPFLSSPRFGKVQLDIADKDITKVNINNVTIGARGVIESPLDLKLPFVNTSYSVELNFGLRFHYKNFFIKQ